MFGEWLLLKKRLQYSTGQRDGRITCAFHACKDAILHAISTQNTQHDYLVSRVAFRMERKQRSEIFRIEMENEQQS